MGYTKRDLLNDIEEFNDDEEIFIDPSAALELGAYGYMFTIGNYDITMAVPEGYDSNWHKISEVED